MLDKRIYKYLLSTDGVNQLERSPLSLDPVSVKLDGRSKQDILRFLIALSSQIRFYEISNIPQGDWRPFFKELTDGNDILPEVLLDNVFKAEKNCPPHLTLLMAFLKIFSYVQEDMNKLSTRRLNFYYEKVLRLLRRPSLVDQVHVIFELAKNASPAKLEKGSLMDAGTATNGTPLLYALDNEYIITHAQIAKIMSETVDQDLSGRHIVYKAEDATQVFGTDNGWRPFGAFQLKASEEKRFMKAALLGCAISSPNFFLAEGKRSVTVKLHLKSTDPVSGNNLQNVLNIEMSGEEGWIKPDKISQALLVPDSGGALLTIRIEFNESSPAIVSYNESIHQNRLNTSWPAWRMTVKPTSFFFDTLSQFTVDEIEIQVDVEGVGNLILQNDQAAQSVDAPVMPFTFSPTVGSNFFIGSAEAFGKSLTSLAVNLEWKDVPEDIALHYADYDNPNIDESDFQCDIYLLAGKKWHKITPTRHPIFDTVSNQNTKTIAIGSDPIQEVIAYKNYNRNPELNLGAGFNQSTQQGFVKMVLTNPRKQDVGNLPVYAPFEAFGHKSFPAIYAQHALQIAQGGSAVLPQPPYTPMLSSVKLDYSAGDKFKPHAPNLVDQFFLLDVFGAVETDESNTATLVPKLSHQGALYLGFEKAEPSQVLSLFFQIEEGSTPGIELLHTNDVVWGYLTGKKWREIPKANILEDKTQGFQVPGLIRLILGPDATNNHSLMPDGLHWIRAGVNENIDGAANVLKIYSQAARASLEISGKEASLFDTHLSSPLQANSIKALKKKNVSIKKVEQPFPSFGGQPSESNRRYYQRIHERLRHRNRAVSAWDFERLILEKFPIIYKIKSLPHTDTDNNLAPGHVKLVVVPDWRKRPTGNPLQPKANGAFLRTIEEFIEENYVSAFTNVHVTNPAYETLLVDCRISFKSGFDPGFYAVQLDDEIKRFLSPWSYDEGEDIVFGGKIHASEILAFIEGREYVEYVSDFSLYHRHKGNLFGGIGEMQVDVDFEVGLTPEPTVGPTGVGKAVGDDFVVGVPVDAAVATRPDAILVSSHEHRIGVLAEDVCEGTQNIGIGQMVVGLDFIIVS